MFTHHSTSYSKFLNSKEPHFHCLTDHAVSVDIEFFRRSISLHYQHVYAAQKWQNHFYRCLFYGLGLIFLVLGILIFFKTTNYMCGVVFKHYGIWIKNGINLTCLMMASGSFFAGYKIHPEKEAIRHLVRKVERELNAPTKELQIEFNAIFANLSYDRSSPP